METISDAMIAGTVLLPQIANADITDKVESSTAVRSVEHAQNKLLGSLELYVVNDQYLEFMDAIQNPPTSDRRKSCTV